MFAKLVCTVRLERPLHALHVSHAILDAMRTEDRKDLVQDFFHNVWLVSFSLLGLQIGNKNNQRIIQNLFFVFCFRATEHGKEPKESLLWVVGVDDVFSEHVEGRVLRKDLEEALEGTGFVFFITHRIH